MEVKGTAFVARRNMLVAEFGEARFAALMARLATRHPVFAAPILAGTTIEIRAFLDFNDAVVADFYQGNTQSLWQFGEKSAAWALTQGPYKHLLTSKSIHDFAESATRIYKNYFNEGYAEAAVSDGRADLSIGGIAPQIRHVYFEYTIVGYFRRGLELVGAKSVQSRRITGFSAGDDAVLYRYTWTE